MWKNPPPQKFQRYLYSFSVGLVAGTTVGTVGWGGAQVIIPSLTVSSYSFATGLSQFAATGVSLTSLSLSVCSSGYKFYIDNKVDLSTSLAIGIPAVLSARFGTKLAHKLSGDALSLFFNGFSIILIPTHFWIQERAKLKRKKEHDQQHDHDHDCASSDCDDESCPIPSSSTTESSNNNDDNTNNDNHIWIQHSFYGLISGVVNALMGVGGLPMTMSYLTEATDLHHHYVQGTSICATIPSIATSAFSRMNVLPLGVTSYVCLGAIIGGYAGANFALHLEEEQLRNVYMGSLAIFGSRSAIGAVRNIRNILHKKKVFR